MAAPSESRALQALKKVQALSGKELDALITQELGTPMLGVFSSLAQAMLPGAKAEDAPKVVHLMVLSYLMRREVEKSK